MIEQRYQTLIEKLISGTKQKKLDWQKTKRETEFKVVLGSSMVTTDNWELESGSMCVDLGIWNSKGESAGRIAFEDNDKEKDDYKTLQTLYITVKNSYYMVDETFAEILNHLDFKD